MNVSYYTYINTWSMSSISYQPWLQISLKEKHTGVVNDPLSQPKVYNFLHCIILKRTCMDNISWKWSVDRVDQFSRSSRQELQLPCLELKWEDLKKSLKSSSLQIFLNFVKMSSICDIGSSLPQKLNDV